MKKDKEGRILWALASPGIFPTPGSGPGTGRTARESRPNYDKCVPSASARRSEGPDEIVGASGFLPARRSTASPGRCFTSTMASGYPGAAQGPGGACA